MEYTNANELQFDPRLQMGRIFADGFYQWLRYFSKDKERLARAFAHIFELKHFIAAVEGDEVAAYIACTGGKPPPIQLDKKELLRELGFVAGRIAHAMLTKHLVKPQYPFEMPEQAGSIEFVATAPEHRGKGVAGGLITHVMDIMPYSEYVLEVAETNTSAVRLYEKLGFAEFQRKPAPKRSGAINFLYMKAKNKGADQGT